ncbi:maestro heat-like repeat-containing protein family member 7 isoform X1 [Prionailurus iriomotensis]
MQMNPGLRQSEREACEFIQEFLEEGQPSESEKLKFLRAVETLSATVQAQANGNMNDYFPKTILAKKIEVLILEESTEVLVSSVHQRAMLCIVALSLYLQTVQALDDMLQALVMEDMDPDMSLLQNFLEIILPWLTLSEKVHQQVRALGTISRMLRFICNFPRLSQHMMEFSMTGKMMGILGLSCMNANHEISVEASEALHYFFKILVLHRRYETEDRDHPEGFAEEFPRRMVCQHTESRNESLAGVTEEYSPTQATAPKSRSHGQHAGGFFRKYLTPKERADVIMVPMEAMTSASRHDVCAASKMLKMILKHPMPEIGKVPEIIQYIYHNMNRITETTAQETIKKILYLLAQTYTEEVILTLFNMEDGSQRGVCKPWEILASFPKGYEVIMEFLLQKLTPYQKSKGQEPSHSTEISPLIATRAIQELLLEPSRRTEVQTFFPSLCMALLFQISFLVVEGDTDFQDQQHATERMDPVSSSVEALKTLMRSTGYGDYVSYIQKLGGWELLTSPEGHYEGVTLLARAMVIKNCWHNRPIFSFLIRILQERDHKNRLTAFVFLTELLQCPDVAATVDEVTVHILANWFQCEEPAIVKLLLRVVETFAKHGNMVQQFRILEPYVLACCYSLDDDIVMETFTVLKCLVEHLTWKHSSSFLTQLTFRLGPLFEEESEYLRLMAFEIYGALLAKVKGTVLVFPLKHQVLNLIVLLVLHLEDANVNVAQICRPALCHTATILGWSRLKAVFAEKDVWTILRALVHPWEIRLKQEGSRALWFLKQCLALFKSPQAPIRQTAVRFAGQIIQTLGAEEANEIEEVYTALKYMREDPDSMVSCLAAQTLYILEAKEKLLVNPPTSCFCSRRPRKTYS